MNANGVGALVHVLSGVVESTIWVARHTFAVPDPGAPSPRTTRCECSAPADGLALSMGRLGSVAKLRVVVGVGSATGALRGRCRLGERRGSLTSRCGRRRSLPGGFGRRDHGTPCRPTASRAFGRVWAGAGRGSGVIRRAVAIGPARARRWLGDRSPVWCSLEAARLAASARRREGQRRTGGRSKWLCRTAEF